MTADELLVRSQFGWSRAGSAGGRRQGSFTFGPENAFDEVSRLLVRELAYTSQQRDEAAVIYKPRNDSELPYVTANFVPGGTVTRPTRAGGTTTDRVMEIQVAWAKDEELIARVVIKDRVLEAQERIVRALKALGA